MKSKMREKVRPKMGKIDIDYQKLHDAFFKWQTKPKLTIHGDLYYEVRAFMAQPNVFLCGGGEQQGQEGAILTDSSPSVPGQGV